jgi:alpha-amylase
MTKNICFTFLVHQPFRLRDFHFFDIGSHQDYFNAETNARILQEVATSSYLPANTLLLRLIETYGSRIKVSFAISGTALDQIEQYAPEVMESFRRLAATGNVEFIGHTYSSSLSSIKSLSLFSNEVKAHKRRLFHCFKMQPQVFLNTGLLYSDAIGKVIAHLGFKGLITEGEAAVLRGNSLNALYENDSEPSLKLFLRNHSLSDDISLRFSQQNWSEWPLTSEKYLDWLSRLPDSDDLVNLVMDYGTFGAHHNSSSGIFDFLEFLFRQIAVSADLRLTTPSEVLRMLSPKETLKVATPISWEGAASPVTAWLDNDMQREAFNALYAFEQAMSRITNKKIHQEWERLKSADHFLYMKNESWGMGNVFNPYDTAYDSFLKYMNVIADFDLKVAELSKKKSSKRPLKTVLIP